MHELSSTIGKLKSQKVKTTIERNRIQFNYLHLSGVQLFFFKCWCWLRCAGQIIKGDTAAYNAMRLLNNKAVRQSQNALLQLQQKNKISLTVKEVERIILNSIKGIPYRVF